MKTWIAVLLGCLAFGIVLAGCGGDDDDSGGSSDNTHKPADEGEGGVQDKGDTDTGGGTQVSLKDIQFQPSKLTVKAGDTITFMNDESVPHDVHKTSGPGPDFSSGDVGGLQEGDTYKLTLDKPGTYEYVCKVHAPGMAGTITVK